VFREVIKEVTLGHVRAFAYDASLPAPPASPGPGDTPLQALADWEPGEVLPDYRRSFIPALERANCGTSHGCGCNDGSDACDKISVTAMVKLGFVPMVSDLDFLPISSVSALKLGMLSVCLEERLDWTGAVRAWQGGFDPYLRKYVGGAMQALEDELAAFQGEGTVAPLRIERGGTGGLHIDTII
jgi:hypothetical protein